MDLGTIEKEHRRGGYKHRDSCTGCWLIMKLNEARREAQRLQAWIDRLEAIKEKKL